MELGLSTYALAWSIGVADSVPAAPIDAFSVVRRTAELGMRVVQIADNLPLELLSSSDRSRLGRLAESLGVQIEPGFRGLTEENLTTYLGIAREFGSSILRGVIDRGSYRPDEKEIASTLAKMVPRLEEAKVTLAIENHDRFTCTEIAGLVRGPGSPYVAICLDTVNSFGALEGPDLVIETLGPLTESLHIKDFAIARVSHQMGFLIEGTVSGKGRLRIPELLSRLHSFGRDPNALIELWVSPEATIQATVEKEQRWLEESVAYMRTLLPKNRG